MSKIKMKNLNPKDATPYASTLIALGTFCETTGCTKVSFEINPDNNTAFLQTSGADIFDHHMIKLPLANGRINSDIIAEFTAAVINLCDDERNNADDSKQSTADKTKVEAVDYTKLSYPFLYITEDELKNVLNPATNTIIALEDVLIPFTFMMASSYLNIGIGSSGPFFPRVKKEDCHNDDLKAISISTKPITFDGAIKLLSKPNEVNEFALFKKLTGMSDMQLHDRCEYLKAKILTRVKNRTNTINFAYLIEWIFDYE